MLSSFEDRSIPDDPFSSGCLSLLVRILPFVGVLAVVNLGPTPITIELFLSPVYLKFIGDKLGTEENRSIGPTSPTISGFQI